MMFWQTFKQTFSHFSHLILYHTSQLATLIVLLFFSFEYFDSFDYYAACYVPLMPLYRLGN